MAVSAALSLFHALCVKGDNWIGAFGDDRVTLALAPFADVPPIFSRSKCKTYAPARNGDRTETFSGDFFAPL